MAEEKNNVEQLDDNLIKALQTVLSKSDFDEFMKGRKTEEKEEPKEEEKEENEEEVLEKAYQKACGEYSEMKKSLKAKKSELEKAYPGKFKDEEEKEEKVEKSQEVDLVKAFGEALDIKLKGINEQNTELIKSLTDIKEENSLLKAKIDEIGSQRPGMKTVTKHSFIEKGEKDELTDSEGKTVLSVSRNKKMVENLLDEAMEKAESPNIKKSLGDTLMNYNSGNSPISQEVATYLYKNHNTRLVQ